MVSYKAIRASNALISNANAPKVSVFVGGTSGIGKLTIEALVSTGTRIKIYLIGRKSAEERMQPWIQNLHTINPEAEIVWIEAEVSLLKSATQSKEKKHAWTYCFLPLATHRLVRARRLQRALRLR